MNIAVVGSGISGIGAAWLLARKHRVTLFEADCRWGGHTNTINVSEPTDHNGTHSLAVDTGFIVYNLATYPNLCAFFDHLGVETAASDMSFAVSADGGRFEYAGTDINGLFAQRRNLFRPRFWRMMRDLLRFYKQAPQDLTDGLPEEMSLGEYLDRNNYSEAFVNDHLLPMAAAIWSSPAMEMRAYPARAFLSFFVNHGLLQLTNRPQWRTVKGGAATYLRKALAENPIEQHPNCAITAINPRPDGVELTDQYGHTHRFDHVVVAAHADQALAMLATPTAGQTSILGAFGYQLNHAWLHRDPDLMPKRRSAWSSWNHLSHKADKSVCVTYWMNKLQPLPTSNDYFVTLNPPAPPAPDLLIKQIDYMHPMFDEAAMAAQKQLWSIQGQGNIWFCGSYFGSGFHEDGLQAGLAVAEVMGGVQRPWQVENPSGRIPAPPPPAGQISISTIAAE